MSSMRRLDVLDAMTDPGRNPVSIVLPCPRVTGSNGWLSGFGGGLEVKATLLELERER